MEFDCLSLESVIGFDWDEGNLYKNEKRHGLKWQEIEEVFFNQPLLLLEDAKHSEYGTLGVSRYLKNTLKT